MAKNKRGKKFFDRDIILWKLAALGEASVEYLLNTSYNLLLSFLDPPKSVSEAISRPLEYPIKLNWREKAAWRASLSRMRHDGFIRTEKEKAKITKAGIQYLKNKCIYKPIYSAREAANPGEVIIVCFDVPERLRQWRDWLRFQLAHFGFHALQRSVWIGEVKLPEEFINDLKKFNLLSYIHILSVNKKGTLSSWFI